MAGTRSDQALTTDALSVSGALALAKRQLESIAVTIVGEVSELSANPSYKAVYFTIKDESSALPCMMWTNRYRAANVQLQIGALVQIRGRFSLYAAKGRMNFSVDEIALAGEGDLRLRVANLAKKLEAEGLMKPSLKKAIPSMPLRIGLVTSPSGAAVYDVLRTLRRRFPLAQISFAGVKVEGAEAPRDMMNALSLLEAQDLDVILLVRGGGSFEDLMPFNDEGLARFIASMRTPLVTGIGHEPDTSIADMVADLRASTPTAAAEAVSPSSGDLSSMLEGTALRLRSIMDKRIENLLASLKLASMTPAFANPMQMVSEQMQTLDTMASKLENAIPRSIERMRMGIMTMRGSMVSVGRTLDQGANNKIRLMRERMRSQATTLITKPQEQVRLSASALSNLSPLAILSRGYSYAYDESGTIVKSIKQVDEGSTFMLRVMDGIIDCEAKELQGLEN